MLFNSFVFLFVFLPVAYVVFWALKTAGSRYIWLTVTGYVFYGYWDPRFCILMAFSTLVSFCAGLGFLRWTDPFRRRVCLFVPIIVDLSLLAFFKYATLILHSLTGIVNAAGGHVQAPDLHIILPIGISFYTFHTISYIVDSYRGVIRPTRNLFEFSAYVSLFSQLIAGPIVRFRQIETDLENLGTAARTRWLSLGISWFVVGLVEKVVIADSLATYVDAALGVHSLLSTGSAWLAMLGYTFQLYFDFAGYSDMAIGLGFMFGLRIPINFNSPYKALDPSDFWRRWHISLSTCLRDYVYIPLGGSRSSELATYRNLLLTMLIGGLWHGANWTFVAWGAYHGVLLAVHRKFGRGWDRINRVVRQLAMFVAALFGWVLFRSTNFRMAADLFHTMLVPRGGDPIDGSVVFAVVILISAYWSMVGPNAAELHANWQWRRARGFLLAGAMGVCLAAMARGADSPFLYFQF